MFHRSWERTPKRGGDAPDTVGYVRPIVPVSCGEGETQERSISVRRESDATKTCNSTAIVREKQHAHASPHKGAFMSFGKLPDQKGVHKTAFGKVRRP